MGKKHIVRSYDDELSRLQLKILEMGTACERQLFQAVKSLKNRDQDLVEKIIADDASVNRIQQEVEQLTIQLLAMRQPMAVDLRNVIAALKMASDLERIADYAANMAGYIKELTDDSLDDPVNIVLKMTDSVFDMLRGVLEAYQERSVEKALQAWLLDKKVNESYEKLLECLHSIMIRQTDRIREATALLFMGRCCERMGDHIKNVAEQIHYISTGSSNINTKK